MRVLLVQLCGDGMAPLASGPLTQLAVKDRLCEVGAGCTDENGVLIRHTNVVSIS